MQKILDYIRKVILTVRFKNNFQQPSVAFVRFKTQLKLSCIKTAYMVKFYCTGRSFTARSVQIKFESGEIYENSDYHGYAP